MPAAPKLSTALLAAIAAAAVALLVALAAGQGRSEPDGRAELLAAAQAQGKRVALRCHDAKRGKRAMRCFVKRRKLPRGKRGPDGPRGAAGATGPGGATGQAGATGATGATGTTGPTGPAVANEIGFANATAASGDLPAFPVALSVLEASFTTTESTRFLAQASIDVDATSAVLPAAVRCQAEVTEGPEGVGNGLGTSHTSVVSPLLPPAEETLSLTGTNPAANPVYDAGTYEVTVFCQQSDGAGTARVIDRTLTVLALGT